MSNQIENQFEGFMVSMYGNKTISEAQKKDVEKSFYAGMIVAHKMMISFDDDEEIAVKQLEKLSLQIVEKVGELSYVQ